MRAQSIITFVSLFALFFLKGRHRVWTWLQRPLFRRCGERVKFGDRCEFSYSQIELGSDVYIGSGATINAALSIVRIGNKVMLGPNVTIMGGDHRTDIVGMYMYDMKEKLPENDADVTIEDDVWIGSNAVILKGVRIGRGSIIGAGSLVLEDVLPYSIYVGRPGVKTRPRWDADTVATHERLLRMRC